MSTLRVEQYPVREAMDAQVAAHMAKEMVNVARTLLALVRPAPLSPVPDAPEAAGSPTPASETPVRPTQPIPVPVPMPEVAHLPGPPNQIPAVVPVAMPALSAIPVPSWEPEATEPAVLADREAFAAPAPSIVPRTMAMLSEIGFLDD